MNKKRIYLFAVIPAYQLHFPWYHPNRSRFFNTATLFMEVMTALGRGVEEFTNKVKQHLKQFRTLKHNFKLLQKWNESIGINFNNPEFGYNNLVKWELVNGKELGLGGFRLTNSQLYFVTSAHKFYNKYQPNVPKYYSPVHRLQNKYLHIYYKISPTFRKVFNCSDLNSNDKAQLSDLLTILATNN